MKGTDEILRFIPRHVDLTLDFDLQLPIDLRSQVGTDRQTIEFERVPNPAKRHVSGVELSLRLPQPTAGSRDRWQSARARELATADSRSAR